MTDISPQAEGPEVDDELLGEGGADVNPPFNNFVHGLRQLAPRAALRDVAVGSRLQGAPREQLLRVHAEDEHGEPGPELLYLFQHLQPVPSAQRDVEQHYIPVLLPHEFECLRRRPCLAEGGRAGLFVEDSSDAVTDDLVIIYQEDSSHRVTKYYAVRVPSPTGGSFRPLP